MLCLRYSVHLRFYFFFGQNLVYTIVVCVIFSSLVANIFKIDFGGGIVENYKKIEIKKPILNFNVIRGSLALADLIGLDVCLAIMGVLNQGFGDQKYRPAPLLKKMVEAGKLGRKTKEGFFTY